MSKDPSLRPAKLDPVIHPINRLKICATLFHSGATDGRQMKYVVLAELTELPADTLSKQLKHLEDSGYISRTREYDADEDGAKLTGDPIALASALNKLEKGVSLYPMDPKNQQVVNTSASMIANPFGGLKNLMSTHPPMDKCIARLQQMTRDNGQL